MIIHVTGPKGAQAADKTRSKGKPAASGGPSFAQLLEQAGAAAPAQGTAPALPVAPYLPLAEDAPQNTRHHAQQLLSTLRQLAQDAFAQTPTATAQRLQTLSEHQTADSSTLTPQQHEVMNELQTRAAVEAAKLKP